MCVAPKLYFVNLTEFIHKLREVMKFKIYEKIIVGR